MTQIGKPIPFPMRVREPQPAPLISAPMPALEPVVLPVLEPAVPVLR